jgi:hypothetical protein
MRSVNHYILGDRSGARSALRDVRLRTLASSPRVQRGRMLALVLAMRALVRLPRVPRVATIFERRWHTPPTAAPRR